MKNVLFPLFTAVFILYSCSNTSTEKVEAEVEDETIVEEANHHHNKEEITLNNGKKWKVDEEMIVFIRNMETSINEFEDETQKDYIALAQVIDENIRELTSNCTMEGQVHDELHKWLVPFIGLSEEFDVATNAVEQERIYQKFKSSFEVFNTYFE